MADNESLTMKISNEVKVGLLATLTIVVGIWGYKFLKGENVLDKTITIYSEFDNAGQIAKSSPIYYKGVEIGTLKEIIFKPETNKPTLVLTIKQNPNIPKNAAVVIFNNGLLTGKALDIVFEKPCSSGDCAQSGDYLRGLTMSAIESMIGQPEALDPYIGKVRGLLDTLNYSLQQPDNEVGKSLRDVQMTLANLRQTTAALSQIMAASATSLNATMTNVASITGNLKANNDKITAMLGNLSEVSAQAKTIDFGKINKATDGAGQSIESLKKTLTETQSSLVELTKTLKGVNEGQGTVGQLATNDSVYHNLNRTLLQTQALVQDLRLNPKRYLNLNPFRKYKPYIAPNQDPLLESLRAYYQNTQPKN